MISINLLPESYRQPTVSPLQEFHRSPLALFVIVILVGFAGLLFTGVQMRQGALAGVNGKLQQLAAPKTAVDELNVLVRELRDQRTVFERLSHARSQWAHHLNVLSDVVPEGVWLTDLSLDPDRGLVIQGSALAQGGQEMLRITRLVEGLKGDKEFGQVLQNVQIESIKRMKEEQIDVVEFTLTTKLVLGGAGG
jgi:Tfp pilus assembly protein PilN